MEEVEKMKVWEAYAGDKKIGCKPITCEMVFRSFQSSDIKACEINNIFNYIATISCDGDCIGHLKRYLESEVVQDENRFLEVEDEFGEKQLRLW